MQPGSHLCMCCKMSIGLNLARSSFRQQRGKRSVPLRSGHHAAWAAGRLAKHFDMTSSCMASRAHAHGLHASVAAAAHQHVSPVVGPQAAPAAQQAPAGGIKGPAQQPQVQPSAAAAAQVGQPLPTHAPWAWAGEEIDHVRALLRALHGYCIQHKARGWTFLERAACNLR